MTIESCLYTAMLCNTVSGDLDTYEGWSQTMNKESVDEDICSDSSSDGLVWIDEDELAKKILDTCNERGEWQPDSYKNGDVEVDDGVDSSTGMMRVHLEPDNLLAYVDQVSIADVTPSKQANCDVNYKVTVVFSHEQVESAKDSSGELSQSSLPWADPYKLIVEEQ